MYYLKFLKWFWNEHLDQTPDKVWFCLIVWVSGLVVSVILGVILKAPIIFGGYLIFSISIAILAFIVVGIQYMRERYNEWQMQVINKLKGE